MKRLLMLSLLTVIFAIYFTGQPTHSRQVIPDWIADDFFQVRVVVTCSDESIKNLIESYIKRELRKLSDVRVTNEKDARLAIHVVAIKSSQTGNIAMATMFLERFQPIYEFMIREELLGDFEKLVKEFPVYVRPTLRVGTGTREKLEEYCQDIVADYDINALEPDRRGREIFRLENE